MPKFTNALQNWQKDSFTTDLVSEIRNLTPGILPLEKCTSQGGFIDDSNITATVLRVEDDVETIDAKVGIFFTEIVTGCGCGDDVEPIKANAYCEMMIIIDKITADTKFEVVPD